MDKPTGYFENVKNNRFFKIYWVLNSYKIFIYLYFLSFAVFIQNVIEAQSISSNLFKYRQRISRDKSSNNTSKPNSLLAGPCTGFSVQQTDASTNSLSHIIQSLVGAGVTITNIQTNLPATSDIYGSFSCASSVIGIEQGLILTSGSIANAKGPNTTAAASRENSLPGYPLLDSLGGEGRDAAVVSFNITPTGKTLTFNYVFASEEYNDYVGSQFNDAFGFFISGPGISGTKNVALLPGSTTPVTINNVNKGRSGSAAFNPQYYINNDVRTLPTIPQAPDPYRYANLEYDGLTVVLSSVISVIPGQTYTLTFAIQDVGDGRLDSGVFIEGGSITSTTDYYSKPTGNLQDVLTWGENIDGSGANPPDFGAGKTFHLVNRVPTYTMTGNWTVGGRLDIPASSILKINSFTLSEADLIGTGTLYGSSTSNLVVTSGITADNALNFASGGGSLNNLTVNRTGGSATVGTALVIYGVLSATNGTLNTGNLITLKSTAFNTARVAPVLGGILGNVTVERFIPARRAWRIVCAPIRGSQSINKAWQEGATTLSSNPNPNPGFGTHITEGSAANGFDHNPYVAMVSIKRYNSSLDNWVPLTNTNVTNVNEDAYMLFVRGDRSIPLGYNNVTPNNTVLRVIGPLKTGDQTFPVSATGFTAIPNPFASPINFATLTRDHVQNNFYLWDPKLGGPDGVGGYVLLSFNGSTYDITPAAVSTESQYIQSGQGFLVQSDGVAGSVVIKESDKSATAATNVFRSLNRTKNLRVTLKEEGDNNTVSIIDEVLASYSSDFSNAIDERDAVKALNLNENLAIVRDGRKFMVERRFEAVQGDTIKLNLSNMADKKYLLEFSPANLSSSINSAYLLDNYEHTSTSISLTEVSRIKFTVNAKNAPTTANRFVIVFGSDDKIQPVTIFKDPISVYPNPIDGTNINISMVDQPAGVYNVTVVNSWGQAVYQGQILHEGGTKVQKVQFSKKLEKGVYQINLSNGNKIIPLKIVSN